MFGLGVAELLILLLIGVILVAIPVGVVLMALHLVRRNDGGQIAALEAETRQLRKELDALRDRASAAAAVRGPNPPS